jgi:hypothetical protein
MTELAAAPVDRDLDLDVEHRLRLIRGDASEDDRMVVLGLIAAGHLPTPPDIEHGRLDQARLDALLKQAGDGRNQMYDLWYRMKIPFGEAALDSWYVLALAMGRTGGDVAAALDLYAAVLEALAEPDAVAAQVFPRHLGVVGASPVAATDDADAWALAEAVLRRTPLELAQKHPWRISMREHAMAPWTVMREEERPVLLIELQERIQGLEQVRFYVDGTLLDNKGVGALLRQCAATDPQNWTMSSLAVATLAWMWREAGFCLQELNQSIICLPHVFDFMVRRIRDYERRLGTPASTLPTSPVELARLLGRLRTRVERDYLRCLQFDGGNWERREFLVSRARCDALLPLPADLRGLVEASFDTTLSGEGPNVWEQAIDAALARGQTPTDVIKVLGRWAANDDALPVDYAIFTTPLGVKLDRPWELEYEDVFCYTAFRDGFDPSSDGVPFDFVGISNAIGQRLRYNVVKKAQNYTLVRRFKAQSFNLPDIAVAEDANHAGHRAAGIRMSCRIPTYIRPGGLVWKGLADVRLNRTVYSHPREFRPSDIPLASRQAVYLGWIADATYARGLLFDAKYGQKLTEAEA